MPIPWDTKKDELEVLWRRRCLPLPDVMDEMAEQGFHASARSYHSKFRQWGWAKYKPRNQVPPIAESAQEIRELEGPTINDLFRPSDTDMPLIIRSMDAISRAQMELDSGSSQDYHCTKLTQAAALGHLSEVERCLIIGASTEAPDTYLNRPIHLAAGGGHAAVVRLLLTWKANVNSRNHWDLLPLHYADSPNIIQALLDHGAKIDAQCSLGETALHRVVSCSASTRCTSTLLQLMSAGADVNIPNQQGLTPFHLLLERGWVRPLRNRSLWTNDVILFLRNKADVRTPLKDGQLPFEAFITKWYVRTRSWDNNGEAVGDEEILQSFLKAGAEISVKTVSGEPFLNALIKSGLLKSRSALTDQVLATADLRLRDRSGFSALNAAIDSNDAELVNRLIKSGAELEAVDDRGWSATYYASGQVCSGEVLQVLLDNGACGMRREQNGDLPVYRAYRYRRYCIDRIFELLIEDFLKPKESCPHHGEKDMEKLWGSSYADECHWWFRYRQMLLRKEWPLAADEFVSDAACMPADIAGSLPKRLMEFAAEYILNSQKTKFLTVPEDYALSTDGHESEFQMLDLYISQVRANIIRILSDCSEKELYIDAKWYKFGFDISKGGQVFNSALFVQTRRF